MLGALAGAVSPCAWALDLGGLGIGAPGSGQITQRSYPVSAFDRLASSLPAQIELLQGEADESVTILTDDNLHSSLEVAVVAGELRLGTREGARCRATHLRVQVALRQLQGLDISGPCRVHADQLRTPTLRLTVTGGGEVQLQQLAARELTIALAGSGRFSATGKAQHLQGSVEGACELQLAHLAARHANLALASSADATLWVAEALDVSVRGSGDLRYYGDAQLRRFLSGSGSIIRLGPLPAGINAFDLG